MKFNNDDRQDLTQPTDEFDGMLDAALGKYSAVEPRAGLEGRILASLGAAPLRSPRRMWLQWALVGAVAATAVVAVLAWRSNPVPHPVIANHPPVTIQERLIERANPALHPTSGAALAKAASMRKPAARRALASTAVAHPKLDQFPSPQPLSAEEIALAKYVENFPKEARLVAQAQEEFELETQKIMNDAGAGILPSTSN